ncbi:EAL domain-containing protein [Actinosynnema sp. CS-041913]|uniref:EAL domain-containing protein n=1 Tax=Actinosynnema sp. CS-041913 TaxID=3239917 RepID=UPI003D8B3799
MLQRIMSWLPGTEQFRLRRLFTSDLAKLKKLWPQAPSEQEMQDILTRLFAEEARNAGRAPAEPVDAEVPHPPRLPEQEGADRPVRFDDTVADWVEAVSRGGNVPVHPRQLRDRLAHLGQALLAHASDTAAEGVSTERIGQDLARELRLTSDAFQNALERIIPWLERVQRLAGRDHPVGRAQAVAALVAGFTDGARDRLFDEQRTVTHAWLAAQDHNLAAQVGDPALFDISFAASRSPCGVLDGDGVVLDANPALLRLLRRTRADLVGRSLFETVADDTGRRALASCLGSVTADPGRSRTAEFAVATPDGHVIAWVAAALARRRRHEAGAGHRDSRDAPGSRNGVLLILEDATEFHAWRQHLLRGNSRDHVMNLHARRHFLRLLGTVLDLASAPTGVTVCALRLDGLATAGAALGQPAADRIVATLTDRITAVLSDQQGTIAARIDQDRFAVALTDSPTGGAVGDVIRRLLDWTSAPVSVDGHHVALAPAVGLARANPVSTAHRLLLDAETMLDRQHTRVSPPDTVTSTYDHHSAYRHLVPQIPYALDHHQIGLAYRPIVRLHGGGLAGAEATAVWHHPEHGTIPADDLLAEAEVLGLSHDYGRWQLDAVAAQASQWARRLGALAPQITLNVSPRLAVEDRFLDDLTAVLDTYDLQPDRILLSMPEQAIIDANGRSQRRLLRLSGMSVPVALAGRGNDITSYDHLENLTISTVVISPVYTAALNSPDQRESEHTVAAHLIRRGLDLTHTVMVNGIHTAEQLRSARHLDAHLGLGEHIGGPLTPDRLEALVPQPTPAA